MPVSGTPVLLAHTTFPVYALNAIDERHFVVGGGGGVSKTGIPNLLQFFELKRQNSKEYTMNVINEEEMGTRVPMNCASRVSTHNSRIQLAVGEDADCVTYSARYELVESAQNGSFVCPIQVPSRGDVVFRTPCRLGSAARQRNVDQSERSSSHESRFKKSVTFAVERMASKRTDYADMDEDSRQKCVSFVNDLTVATAGADGYLRVWKVSIKFEGTIIMVLRRKWSDMEKLCEVRAHKDEIDDLDCTPQFIVTVSRDCSGKVWRSEDCSKVSSLDWTDGTDAKYRMRNCRFGGVAGRGRSNELRLFTTHIPLKRVKPLKECYLTRWSTSNWSAERSVRTGTDCTSSLAISVDGTFLGLGTISGHVRIYIAFSLQCAYSVDCAHSVFVTSLAFAHPRHSAHLGSDAALLSTGADNRILLHDLPARSEISYLWVIVGAVVLTYSAMVLISNLGFDL